MDCSHCVSEKNCSYGDKASAIENKCDGWKIKSCSTCLFHNNESCQFLKDLKNPPVFSFYCFKWTQIPYKAILIIPGKRLYDYHRVKYNILQITGISESDLMSHIPPEAEGDEVEVVQDVEKLVSLIYLPVYRRYVFIHKDGLKIQEKES